MFKGIFSFLKRWKKEVIRLFSDWHYGLISIIGLALLISSLFLSVYLSHLNDSLVVARPVGDLLFEVLPIVNLTYLFVFGGLFIVIVGVFYCIFIEPKKIPLVLFAYSFFVLIRAICISLTHIAIPPDHIDAVSTPFGEYFFQNDLFFSGHTGVPFLGALLLWKKRKWRYFFLLSSVIMAFTVLLMRVHYSIDVVGAYFITYGIYHLSLYIFHAKSIHNKILMRWFLYEENMVQKKRTKRL